MRRVDGTSRGPAIAGNSSKFWLVGATVDGLTAQLGLRIRVSIIQDAEGETIPSPDKATSLLLIPWGILQRSVLVDKKARQDRLPPRLQIGSR